MSSRVALGSDVNTNRIFIDLTDSDDKEVPVSVVPFVTSLAHRSPAKAPTPVVPSKRSLSTSEKLSDASSDEIVVFGRSQRKRFSPANNVTPSPPLSQTKVSVVITPPTVRQQRQFAHAISISSTSTNGLCERHFPVNEEEERVSRAAYPFARERSTRSRKDVVLSFKLGASSTLKLESSTSGNHLSALRDTLQAKLDSIEGPSITHEVSSPKLLAKLADNFVFINKYQYRAGVVPLSEDFICGCTCVDGCEPTQCDCLAQEEETEGHIVPYERCIQDPKLFVISKDFLHRKSMIFECTASCNCQGEKCWNHVVQKGRTVRLEIFDTGPRGFGLRSPDPIYAGQFIDHYLGEVITKAEADAREALSEGDHGQSYLFDLDWWVGHEDADGHEDVDEDTMNVIDGRKFGSASRFMNHSCVPNCKIVAVSIKNHSDKRLYNLAFFANRDISPGTELTFDYNAGTESKKPHRIDPDAVPCLCGEKKCRGQLWPNKRKGKR